MFKNSAVMDAKSKWSGINHASESSSLSGPCGLVRQPSLSLSSLSLFSLSLSNSCYYAFKGSESIVTHVSWKEPVAVAFMNYFPLFPVSPISICSKILQLLGFNIEMSSLSPHEYLFHLIKKNNNDNVI